MENINLAEFLSVCIFLSEECGKIIRQVKDDGKNTNITAKSEPVTEADLRIQKTIEVCLKSLYPTLKVKGEESKESIQDIEPAIKPEQITKDIKQFITTEKLNASHFGRQSYIEKLRKTYSVEEIQSENFETFNTEHAVVWIDPLDGTSDFVKNNLPAVTVLIGLSINGFSRAGVVHNPYDADN